MTPLRTKLIGAADGMVAIGPVRALSLTTAKTIGPSSLLKPTDRVALCLSDPLVLIEMLIALDSTVAALTLISASQVPEVVAALAHVTDSTVLVTDRSDLGGCAHSVWTPVQALAKAAPETAPMATVWLMTTSGTTGLPKVVPHNLLDLTRTVHPFPPSREPRWGLVYDPTRFAGMQVTLQALLGGGTLLIPDPQAPLGERLAWLAGQGCTHLSATPTLWRRLLMLPQGRSLALKQITLGGERVDQGLLDALALAFPTARLTHIYASTEAGVGFAVQDGRAGFPVTFFDQPPSGVRLKVVNGLLWLQPPGPLVPSMTDVDAEGFLCSGDLVRVDEDRAYILGRESGLINVGGAKVSPETVEQTILRVPGVRLVKVSARPSPIVGALVMAEVLADAGTDQNTLKALILQECRNGLGREAMPGLVRFVDDLEMNSAGKLVRRTTEGT